MWAGNAAAGDGGAVRLLLFSSGLFRRSFFSGNVAGGYGGAVRVTHLAATTNLARRSLQRTRAGDLGPWFSARRG